MSQATTDVLESKDFFLRRLHSLTGLVPIGAFLVMHLTVNSLVAFSGGDRDYYQEAVHRLHALGPFLVPAEIFFIFLPILFHGLLGLKIWRESQPNIRNYPYWCNFRYTLQRITGVIVFVFIAVHLWHMHWLGEFVPGTSGALFDPDKASATAAYAMQTHKWWTVPVYTVGIVCSCYHFATGLWTFMITWGITVGGRAQDRMGWICAGIGVLVAIAGLTSQFGLLRWRNPEPRTGEIRAAWIAPQLCPLAQAKPHHDSLSKGGVDQTPPPIKSGSDRASPLNKDGHSKDGLNHASPLNKRALNHASPLYKGGPRGVLPDFKSASVTKVPHSLN